MIQYHNSSTIVHGDWGNWNAWGACTVTCLGGTQTRDRACDNPAPVHGGNDCDGNNDESQPCNTGPCRRKSFLGILFQLHAIKICI